MSTAYTYPGIYIQELPLNAQTITPAPTSITAFVGYTHPWKTTVPWSQAQRIYSFSDYETYFGGIFTSGYVDSSVARAVYAFFLNGGNNAYVVPLLPSAHGTSTSVQFGGASTDVFFSANINPNTAVPSVGIALQAIEPADQVPLVARVANIRLNSLSAYTVFDLVLSYGTRVETYRGLDISIPFNTTGSIDKVLNGVSSLVTAAPIGGGTSYGTVFAGTPPTPQTVSFSITPQNLPSGYSGSYAAGDFLPIFQPNSGLDTVEIFNILLVPGVVDNSVIGAALAFAETKRAFTILDPPPQATAFQIPNGTSPTLESLLPGVPLSQNGALYFPYLNTTDPVTGLPCPVAPGGFVAGIYATTDSDRGVWKAPAGMATTLLGTTGPVANGVMNDMQQGALYSEESVVPVNCLRSFSGAGTVVYGARTLVANDDAFAQSKYVPVRRMTLFIEQSLIANMKWAVFEPNDEPLWLAIKSEIEAFLLSLFNQQALQGSTPSDAFQVKCDSTTTSSQDQQNGIVNIVVSVALLKPAEFVVIKIAQIAGQTS
jgi:phage tail sheath protein FI